MTSFLTKMPASIARGFKGKLDTGIIQANQNEGLDEFGDEIPPDVPVQYTFTGIRENFDAAWMVRALIPITDVSVLILLGSVSPVYTPLQDDYIFIKSQWHKIRRILKVDPAAASMLVQCWVVPAPGTAS